MATKPVLLSGIQPSGALNIGNYIGAIRNWAHLQDKYHCLFFLADLHSITVRQDPQELRRHCYDVLALYIACGLSPEENILFCQSHVAEHSQLAWVLNCYAHMGDLSRMTQFKDKSKKQKNINVGLFAYPVLQAADVLLYQANLVPVGADQKQHLELVRDIAIRFNNIYGDIFTVPEPYIADVAAGARIMALQDPEKKMSKSDSNLNNVVQLLDDPKVIVKKVKRAVTDSGTEVLFHESKPGVANLLTIFAAISGKAIKQLEAEYAGLGYGKFKGDLAELLVEFLRPIQQRFHELREDEKQLNKILQTGAEKARPMAAKTLQAVYDAIGFVLL